MIRTYRELLEAIRVANELVDVLEITKRNPKRWKGTPEEQDDADAKFKTADRALDQEIP